MWIVAITPPHTGFSSLISLRASVAGDSPSPGSRQSHPSPSIGAIGGLGQSLTAAGVEPKTKAQIQKHSKKEPRQQRTQEGSQISGSDVLWALHRATAEKKRSNAVKRKKKMGIGSVSGSESSADESTIQNRLDYSHVRPLRVKTEWAARLDELETRLKELEEAI